MEKYFNVASDLPEKDNLYFNVAGDLPEKEDLSLNISNNNFSKDDENDDYMEKMMENLKDFLPFGEGEALVSSNKYQEMVNNGCNIISSKYWEDIDMYTIVYELKLQHDEEKTQEDGVKLQLGNTNGFSFSNVP